MPRAVVYRTVGGPDVLHVEEVPARLAGPGEVLVQVEAAGVNPIDAKLRSGRRAAPPITEPRRVGTDAGGTVLAVGTGVEGFRPGMPVAVRGTFGAYADEIVARAEDVFPRPAGVDAATAAALGVPIGTAYQSLRSLAIGPDDTLLLHGGSGAVGRAAVQFAVAGGARVLATSSERRAEGLRALGAEPLRYGDGLLGRVREAAPAGVTAALDCVGTDEALEVSLAVVADRSRIVTLARGADADALGIRAFLGGSPHPLTAGEEAWRREAMPVALALLAAGAFSVELGPALPLEDAAEAHRLLEAGTDGKIVLIP